MPLKDRISEAITGSRKTKADIARACAVTNAAVTHWLSGDTANLKADKALALEVATGYRAQWILTGRGSKKADAPYWPFAMPIERFLALQDQGKGYVESRLEQAIEAWEARSSDPAEAEASYNRTLLRPLAKKSQLKKSA